MSLHRSIVLLLMTLLAASSLFASEADNAPRPAPVVPPVGSKILTGLKIAGPKVNAASAVLMDADTGVVLYSKKGHTRRPMASTTKVMTAILIIEHCNLDDIICASEKVCETPFTSLHLKSGETITVRDLLNGLMVRSANDAAVAAAEHISKTTTQFAKLMNKKAHLIGCRDTNFVTPNGLYDPKHYSTAYDMTLIARYAFRYPVFNAVVKTRKYTLESRSKNRLDMVVFSKSKFLQKYAGADGVKSGFLSQAGHCYIGSATRDGRRLVSTVLSSESAASDTAALMDYGFNNTHLECVARVDDVSEIVKIENGKSGSVKAVLRKNLDVVVPNEGARIETRVKLAKIVAPVAKGARVGKMIALVNGKPEVSVDLLAQNDVEVSYTGRTLQYGGVACLVGLIGFVGGKYGAASSKNHGLRGNRVASALRDFDRYR